MTDVVSNHKGPLGLPGGPVLVPGVRTDVPGWIALRNHPVVSHWLKVGVLSQCDAEAAAVEARKADPLDHDGDGRKGGSVAAEPSDELTKVRADYQALFGKRPFMGWGLAELQSKIDAKLAE